MNGAQGIIDTILENARDDAAHTLAQAREKAKKLHDAAEEGAKNRLDAALERAESDAAQRRHAGAADGQEQCGSGPGDGADRAATERKRPRPAVSWSQSKAFTRTRSHRLKICVPRGLGGLPSTSAWGYLDSHRHRLPLLFANNIRILYTMIYFYYHSRNKYINYLHIST